MCVDVTSELKQRGIKQATASAFEILKELKGGADTAYQARQNVLHSKNINILQTALDFELNGEASCTKYTYLYAINMRKRVHSFLQVRSGVNFGDSNSSTSPLLIEPAANKSTFHLRSNTGRALGYTT